MYIIHDHDNAFYYVCHVYNFPTDIDECKSDTDNICNEVDNSQCINTEGSYICDCEIGYTGNGYINCTST